MIEIWWLGGGMGFQECVDGFGEALDGICDVVENCDVCGGPLYDGMGRSLKRHHIECRMVENSERGCEY